ncbi:MAG: Amidophosphoribosyltransferase [Brockia lithotrophica]|uniref:Amidophosphoribosyltransferase n=1 Tax=Brockia lithotrophica TaxID=933949 RepID=A0A2T5GAQ1_9BACL|nr:hypothetical protein [Brockia lithotrophica]MBT9253868.1 hypothetical protein [Brockia lithotrophica]PTQ53262.1 MAG: Amidophosphoribosyltransferase [Brockia lithotrophica]
MKGGGLFALYLPPLGGGKGGPKVEEEVQSLASRAVHALLHRGGRVLGLTPPERRVSVPEGETEERGRDGGPRVAVGIGESSPVRLGSGALGALALALAEGGGWIDVSPSDVASGEGAVAYLGPLAPEEAEGVRAVLAGRPWPAALPSPYAAVMVERDGLSAVRDATGVYPLFVGRKGDLVALASETSPLEALGFSVSEVRAGQVSRWRWNGSEMRYIPRPLPGTPEGGEEPAPRRDANSFARGVCAFELLYVSRPDSRLFGVSLYAARKRLGEELARRAPAEADMVVYAPDTAFPQALGYAQTLGLPLEGVLVKSPAAPRSFLLAQGERDAVLEAKFALVRELVHGKRLVLVDDSLVYGSTAARLLKLLRDAGARAVHVRIASPPVTAPCVYGFFGPETPPMGVMSRGELAAHIGADSLAYLDFETFAALFPRGSVCTACLVPRDG